MLPTGASYTVRLAGAVTVSALDCGVSLFFCDLHQEGKLGFGNYGRHCIYSEATNTLKFQYVYVAAASTQAAYLIHTTGFLEIDRLTVDIEGYYPQNLAYVRVDAIGSIPTGLNCILGTVAVGVVAPNTSIVYLDTTDTDQFAGKVALDNLSSYSTVFRAVVETTGRSPAGQVEETQVLAAPWVLNSTADGLSSIVATHRPDVLRRRGSFAKGSGIIRPRRPVDGQFTEFRCTGAGVYQTGAPGAAPRWTGLAPLDDSGAGLATYVQANPCWTAGGTAAAPGPVGDLAACQFLDGYLGAGNLGAGYTAIFTKFGAALPAGVPAPSSSILAALVTQPPGTGYAIAGEVSGGGYARQAVAFGASSGGVISNSGVITFPALTAPVGTIMGIALLDAGTGFVVGGAPLNPLATAAGTIVAVPAGTLALRLVPVPTGGALAPQLGYVAPATADAFNNWLLRGQAIAPPPGLQFALSTAPASASPPAEPTGNGYARVAAPAWSPNYYAGPAGTLPGVISNGAAAAFPTPTGSWGTIKSLYLLDGSGNVICSGNLTIPRTPAAGSPAPTVAAGAFWVSW